MDVMLISHAYRWNVSYLHILPYRAIKDFDYDMLIIIAERRLVKIVLISNTGL